MTSEQIFERFFSGGNCSCHYLVKFSHPDLNPVMLINNNESVTYEGDQYQASSFEYTEPDLEGNGAGLSITGIDNGLIEFFDKADDDYRMDVVGIIAEDGEFTAFKGIKHFYGTLSYDETQKISFQPGKDDRLEQTFCVYQYDTLSNPGNA